MLVMTIPCYFGPSVDVLVVTCTSSTMFPEPLRELTTSSHTALEQQTNEEITDTHVEDHVRWTVLSDGESCSSLEAHCVYYTLLSGETGMLHALEQGVKFFQS